MRVTHFKQKNMKTLKELEKAYQDLKKQKTGYKEDPIDTLRLLVNWSNYRHEYKNTNKTVNELLKEFYRASLSIDPEL